MDYKYFDIKEAREHLENIERELTILRKLIETPTGMQESRNETRIQELREQLITEGLDEELVQLVGTVPLYSGNYKEEIRAVIYEKNKRKQVSKKVVKF